MLFNPNCCAIAADVSILVDDGVEVATEPDDVPDAAVLATEVNPNPVLFAVVAIFKPVDVDGVDVVAVDDVVSDFFALAPKMRQTTAAVDIVLIVL